MLILEKYIYLITFLAIVLPFVFLIILKKDLIEKIKLYNLNKISGIILTFIGFAYLSYSIINLSYIHLMMGDLCMMLGVISGPILLLNNERLIKAILPWIFIGGLLTTLISHPPFVEEGIIPGIISYTKHISLFTIGLIGLCTNRYSKKDGIYVLLFIAIFITYIICTSGMAYWITGEEKYGGWSSALLQSSYKEITFTSGMLTITTNDYVIMNDIGIPYPWPSIIFLGVVILVAYLCIWIGGIVQSYQKVKVIKNM